MRKLDRIYRTKAVYYSTRTRKMMEENFFSHSVSYARLLAPFKAHQQKWFYWKVNAYKILEHIFTTAKWTLSTSALKLIEAIMNFFLHLHLTTSTFQYYAIYGTICEMLCLNFNSIYRDPHEVSKTLLIIWMNRNALIYLYFIQLHFHVLEGFILLWVSMCVSFFRLKTMSFSLSIYLLLFFFLSFFTYIIFRSVHG